MNKEPKPPASIIHVSQSSKLRILLVSLSPFHCSKFRVQGPSLAKREGRFDALDDVDGKSRICLSFSNSRGSSLQIERVTSSSD